MDAATFHSIYTVLVFVFFIAIIFWAWSGKRKASFDAAARMPLEDDDVVITADKKENQNG